jgi:hypothetical protein
MAHKAPKKPKPHYLEPRTDKQFDTQRRVLDALSHKRRNPSLGLSSVAKNMGTTVKTVRRYAGEALEMRGGRFDVKSIDHISRTMRLLTPTGEVAVTVRNSRDASRISKHNNAVKTALYSFGLDTHELDRFRGKSLRAGGQIYTFAADFDTVTRLARAGSVHFSDIYPKDFSS